MGHGCSCGTFDCDFWSITGSTADDAAEDDATGVDLLSVVGCAKMVEAEDEESSEPISFVCDLFSIIANTVVDANEEDEEEDDKALFFGEFRFVAEARD